MGVLLQRLKGCLTCCFSRPVSNDTATSSMPSTTSCFMIEGLRTSTDKIVVKRFARLGRSSQFIAGVLGSADKHDRSDAALYSWIICLVHKASQRSGERSWRCYLDLALGFSYEGWVAQPRPLEWKCTNMPACRANQETP